MRKLQTLTLLILLMVPVAFTGCTESETTTSTKPVPPPMPSPANLPRPVLVSVNKHCPIMGGEVTEEGGQIGWNGNTVGFCCPGCIDKWIALSEDDKAAKLASADKEHGDHEHGDTDPGSEKPDAPAEDSQSS